MEETFNIVELIEQNPITKLNGNYQNKLIDKIKEKFTEIEQQMFVASFYSYLKYDSTNDFVIDLDDVWKWLGFAQKVKAKNLLENHFIVNKDYQVLLSQSGKQNMHTRGGHNKETIMLNIITFKKFCLKAGTKKADEIHDYFIKLENVFHEVLQEESNELKLQLEQKSLEIQSIEKDKDKIREKTLLEQFPNNIQCVYYGTIDNITDQNEKLIKFGNSNFLKNRVIKHKDTYLNFKLINAFKVENKLQIENALKTHPLFMERQRNLNLKGKKYIEVLNIDGITFTEIDKIIKDIIINIEYSPENYKKILEENKTLRQNLEEKNQTNNVNTLILLETENERIKNENVKILKINNKLIKLVNEYKRFFNKLDMPNIYDINNNNNNNNDNNKQMYNTITTNSFNKIRNQNGTYTIDQKIYTKLCGTRDDVWNGISYKTSGGLIKENLMMNKLGKIVSKKKCIQETIINRFEKFGVNKPKEQKDIIS